MIKSTELMILLILLVHDLVQLQMYAIKFIIVIYKNYTFYRDIYLSFTIFTSIVIIIYDNVLMLTSVQGYYINVPAVASAVLKLTSKENGIGHAPVGSNTIAHISTYPIPPSIAV